MFVSTAGVHHRDQVIRTASRHFGVGWHRRVGAVRGAAFHFDALEGHAARCRIVVVAFGVARALLLAMVVAISFLVFALWLFAVIVAMVLTFGMRGLVLLRVVVRFAFGVLVRRFFLMRGLFLMPVPVLFLTFRPCSQWPR